MPTEPTANRIMVVKVPEHRAEGAIGETPELEATFPVVKPPPAFGMPISEAKKSPPALAMKSAGARPEELVISNDNGPLNWGGLVPLPQTEVDVQSTKDPKEPKGEAVPLEPDM